MGLWPLSPWPILQGLDGERVLLLCCVGPLPLCMWEEGEVRKQEWSGPTQSLSQSQVHTNSPLSNASNLYFVLHPPPYHSFYKKPKLKVENDRPDITEPIRTHSLSLSGFF